MEQRIYDFCPKCGAITLNGVCSSCGRSGRVKRAVHSEKNVSSHVHTSEDDVRKNIYGSDPKSSPKVKGGKKLIIIWFVFVLFSMIIGVIVFSYSNIQNVRRSTEGVINEFIEEDENRSDYEEYSEQSSQIDAGDSVWDSTHKNHFGENFDDEFYNQIVDCIDESTGYDVVRKEFVHKDLDTSMDIFVSYVQIENVENERDISYINEILSREADYYEEALEDEEAIQLYSDCIIRCDMYVTYNDADKMSIVLNEQTDWGEGYISSDVSAYTIDLTVGSIIYGYEMLNYDTEFVNEWNKINEKQNGNASSLGVEFSKQEMIELLNSSSCIAFYTPLGMEVGFNYYDDDTGISGWITVTMKTYEKYMKKM